MKSKSAIIILTAATLSGGLALSASASEQTDAAAQAKLEAKAKVTRAEAEAIAGKTVPSGKIKAGEIEEENGLLIWSFDMTTPGAKNITEVNVDAKTGKVVAIDHESAGTEKAEKD